MKIQIETTAQVMQLLQRLSDYGLHGVTIEAVAEELLRARLAEIFPPSKPFLWPEPPQPRRRRRKKRK